MRSTGGRAIFLSRIFLSGRPGTLPPGFWRSRKKSGSSRWLQIFIFLAFTGIAASAAHAQEHLTFSPTAANFGNVAIGTSKTIQVTITNSGSTGIVVTSAKLVGAMYTVSGITPPVAIAPGAKVVMSIKFAPTEAGSMPGSVIIGAGASRTTISSLTFSLSAAGVAASPLQATPSSVQFGSVPVGTSIFKSVQLMNPGSHSTTISSATVSGAGFSTTGLTMPMTLAAGSTKSFTLKFAPTGIGTDSGTITLKSSSGAAELMLLMSGTGVKATGTISALPTSLTFGNKTVGGTETLPVTLKNTGSTTVTISQVTLAGIDTSITSGLNYATLAPGQTTTLDVTFAPKSAVLMSGSVKISSNATNSPTVVTLGGQGVSSPPPATPHSVLLRWDASTSSGVVGYNVYRATSPSTTYEKLADSSVLDYTDETVEAGTTYTYAVTAVNSAGEESVHSGSVTAVIP